MTTPAHTPRKPWMLAASLAPVLETAREPSASSTVGRPHRWPRSKGDTSKEAVLGSKAIGLPALQKKRCVTSIMGSIEDFCAFGGKLGQGGGGVVSEVRMEGFPVQLAGKAVEKTNSTGVGFDATSWRKIAEVLLNVSHPHIVQLHEIIEDDNMFYTVMERCHGGTLLSYTRDHRKIALPTVRNLGQQVISAVAFLHSRGILHRDLKPENILLVNNGQEVAKIADFDLCAFVGTDGVFISSMVQGTGGFLAPEAITERRYSAQSDLFAFGCVLHFLLFRQLPLSGIRLEKGVDPAEVAAQTIFAAEQAVRRSQDALSGGAHAEARRLINSCLSVDPSERPCSAMEVLRSGFLASQTSRKGLKGKNLHYDQQCIRFLSSFRSPTEVATRCERSSNH